MKDTRSFKEKSFQTNMDDFLENVSDLDFYRLVNFLNSTFITTKPDELQTEFIDEFFGLDEWEGFMKQAANTTITFYSTHYIHVAETLKEIKEFLLFRLSHRFIDLLSEKGKLDLKLNKTKVKVLKEKTKVATEDFNAKKLKLELHEAVENSIDEDGIFWKDDGWINVSTVLIENNLLKLE